MALLDAYERKARLTPGLLAFAPIAFAVATLGFKKYPAIAIAVGVLSAAGGGYALSVIVGNFGRRAQTQLWNAWDGAPTTRLLRTRDTTVSAVQRDVWRRAVEAITDVALLPAADEINDPMLADDTIKTAVDQIRPLGQDARFPLVKAENVQYGFERNLYGFRWVGRIISIACAATLALVLLTTRSSYQALSHGALISGVAIDAALFLTWVFVPSANRTRAAGERYAHQLFQAAVNVSRQIGASGSADTGPSSENDA
jgi:hypothetical protein